MITTKAAATLLGLAALAMSGAVSAAKPAAAEASHDGCWGPSMDPVANQPKYAHRRMWCHNYLPGHVYDFRNGKWTKVGYLRSTTSWFVCQRKSRHGNQNPPVGGARNDIWLWTQGDDAYDSAGGWGWFPATYVSGGGNYEPIPGLRSCDGDPKYNDDGTKGSQPPPKRDGPPEDPPSKIEDRSRYILKGSNCEGKTRLARPALVTFYVRYGDWRRNQFGAGKGEWQRGPSPWYRLATVRIKPLVCMDEKPWKVFPDPINIDVQSVGLKADRTPTGHGNANGYGVTLEGYRNGALRLRAIECGVTKKWHKPAFEIGGLVVRRNLAAVGLYTLEKVADKINPGGKLKCLRLGYFPTYLETNRRGKFVVDLPGGRLQTKHDDTRGGPHDNNTFRIDTKAEVTNYDDRRGGPGGNKPR